jgi:hypothetical protein
MISAMGKTTAAWAVLALLLAALLLGAVTFDRRQWPSVVGDEASYWMAAASLAHDFDLRYERRDYDRFVAAWGQPPEGLILQSPDGGQTLIYGKPFFYPLYLAPFVRLAPLHGPLVANVLLLALAVGMACRTMRHRLGWAAPLWGTGFVFASVTFAHVFWIHADLFLMSLTALGLAAIYGGPGQERESRPQALPEIYQDPTQDGSRKERRLRLLRWTCAGALLGVVAVARPFYGALLLPALLAAWGRGRRNLWPLTAGVVLVLAVTALVNLGTRETWSSYGGVRHAFYSYTGFPAVDLNAADWQQRSAERGTNSWLRAAGVVRPFDGGEARRLGWNAVYYLVGRHVGLLPYFLPLFFALLVYRGGGGRWALLLAVALGALCFFWVRPVNFFGGGGALANRYFLPFYPAFWFLPGRPLFDSFGGWRRTLRWLAVPVLPLLMFLFAAPFLTPLWTAPRAYPIAEAGGLRHVSSFARAWLPYETTQSHLKPSGQEDVLHGTLWVKPLTPGIVPLDGGAWLRLPADGGTLLVGNPQPLTELWVQCAAPCPARLEVDGGEVAETILRPDGGSALRITLQAPRARHPMWWGSGDITLYQLRLTLPEDLPARPSSFAVHLGTFVSQQRR